MAWTHSILVVFLVATCLEACSRGEEQLPEPLMQAGICSPPKVVRGTRPIGLPNWTGGRLTVAVRIGPDGHMLRAWLPNATEAQASEMKERLAFAFEAAEFTAAQDCQGRPVEAVLTETLVAVE